MGFFTKSRRQRLVEIYNKLAKDISYDTDAESVLSKYPKLELYEAVLISAYAERDKTAKEFDEALNKLGVK